MSTWEILNASTALSARVDLEHIAPGGERTVFEVAVREGVCQDSRNDDEIERLLAAKFNGAWRRLTQWIERD